MNLTEALVLFSMSTTSEVLSVLLVAVACFLRWRRSKTKARLTMMLGSIFTLLGPLLLFVSLTTNKGEEVESGMYVVHTNWWDIYLPFIAPLGFLAFGAAFLFESLNLKRTDPPPQQHDGR